METKKLLKRNIIFIAILALLYLLCDGVLSPIYTFVCSDILYSEGYLPFVLELAMDICQLFIWCHLFSSVISSFYLYGTRNSLFMLTSAPLMILIRYFLILILTAIILNNPIGSEDVFDALLYFFLDAIQLFAAFLAANIMIKNRDNTPKKLSPFGRSGGNLRKLRISAAICGGIITAVRVAMRIRYDIFYGAPESLIDFSWMIVYYFSDFVYGFLSYLFILIFINIQCKNKASA